MAKSAKEGGKALGDKNAHFCFQRGNSQKEVRAEKDVADSLQGYIGDGGTAPCEIEATCQGGRFAGKKKQEICVQI